MFSPGFRLFFGFALAAVVGTFVYGITSNVGGDIDYFGFVDAEAWLGAISIGWTGGVGDHVGYTILLFFAVAASLIAVMLVAFRDADADAVAELAGGELPAAQGPTTPNYWPIISAFGVGVLVIGFVTHASITVVGLLIIIAAMFEWMMSAWADRATGDPAANKELRTRIMGPIELPVLGALGVAALVLAVSRVLLAVSKEWAVWIAVIASAAIFLAAVALAAVDKPNKHLVAAVLSIAAIGAIAGGVISASIGERDFHHEEEHSEGEEGAAEEGAEE